MYRAFQNRLIARGANRSGSLRANPRDDKVTRKIRAMMSDTQVGAPGWDQINVEVSDSSASIAQRGLLKTVLITFEITLREEFGKLVSNCGVGFNFISFNNSPRIFDIRDYIEGSLLKNCSGKNGKR